MEDLDSIARRENIFAKFREVNTEYENLREHISELHTKVNEKRTERDQLKRLISIMIEHDCCPVEAQLKYTEDLEDDVHNPKMAYAVEVGDAIDSDRRKSTNTTMKIIKQEVEAWQTQRNNKNSKINWQFTNKARNYFGQLIQPLLPNKRGKKIDETNHNIELP